MNADEQEAHLKSLGKTEFLGGVATMLVAQSSIFFALSKDLEALICIVVAVGVYYLKYLMKGQRHIGQVKKDIKKEKKIVVSNLED